MGNRKASKSITWAPHARTTLSSPTLVFLPPTRPFLLEGSSTCSLPPPPPMTACAHAELGSWGRVPAPYPCHRSLAPLQPPGCRNEPERLRQELLFIPQGLMSSTGEHNGEQQQQPDYQGVFLERAGGVAEPFFPVAEGFHHRPLLPKPHTHRWLTARRCCSVPCASICC